MMGRSFAAGFCGLATIVGLVLPLIALAQTTTRVNVSSDGVQAAARNSYLPAISRDGRFVAFYTAASNLVPGDSNDDDDVFVHDRQTGITERISVKTDGDQGYGPSRYPSISRDGRYVAFWTFASLVKSDDNSYADIYVHDRQTKITKRVTLSPLGRAYYVSAPSISDDGQLVAFSSDAPHFVSGDTNGNDDVFVHNYKTGLTTRVSVDSSGQEVLYGGRLPYGQRTISGDGRYVVFYSADAGLVSGDSNQVGDVFVRDLQVGTTERVSVNSNGTEANGGSYFVTISADGRFVAFVSSGSNLDIGDTNSQEDVFVRDRQRGTTERIRAATTGDVQYVEGISISDDGRFVAFDSRAHDLVLNDTNQTRDVFIHDRQVDLTTRVSLGEDRFDNGDSASPALSGDGRFVSFISNDIEIVSPDMNGSTIDVFVRGPLTTGQPEVEIDLGGTIKTPDGTDICAMVLASGKFMFSCNPTGVLSLTGLPSEPDGTVKRQIYADGFFPKIDILTGFSDDAVVIMNHSGTCPNYNTLIDPNVYPDSADKWIDISGSVKVGNNGDPICAMVLANGQHMFSCDGSGSYGLNIPLDSNGQFKLQVYADGFAPTIHTFDEFSAANDVRMARATECQ